jgi:hypothetical protein
MANQTISPSVTNVAEQLAELHLKHELERFSNTQFIAWLESESPMFFDAFSQIKLSEFVAAKDVKDIIKEQVVEQDIPGPIAEIAGEASAKLFSSQKHLDTPLKVIMSAEQFEGFVNKLLELKTQRHNLINGLIDLPVYKDLISGVIYQAITRYIYDSNVLSKNIPGVSSMLKMSRNVVNKTVPKLGGAVEEGIRNYIKNNLSLFQQESKSFLINTLTEEELQASILDFWDSIENKTLGEIQTDMSAVDLSDLVVLGYEFWLSFRKTSYFEHCYHSVVDYLFDTYGNEPMAILFEDLDLSPEKILKQAEQWAPHLLSQLRNSGQLETILQRRLTHFYHSEKALQLLSKAFDEEVELA